LQSAGKCFDVKFFSGVLFLVKFIISRICSKMYLKNGELYKLRVLNETTNDRCVIKDVNKSTTVEILKEKIEGLTGIPSFLLQLYYLDECPLLSSKHLGYFHVQGDAKLRANVWRSHRQLVVAARKGDLEDLVKELQSKSSTCKTRFDPERCLTALYIACYYGNCDIVEYLLKQGVECRKKLPSGKDSIFVAALRGNIKCVELLLRRKVRPHEWNNERMSLTNWELQDRIKTTLDRIEQTKTTTNACTQSRLTYSQHYDSSFATWYTGSHAQLYLCEILKGTKRKDREDGRPVFKP